MNKFDCKFTFCIDSATRSIIIFENLLFPADSFKSRFSVEEERLMRSGGKEFAIVMRHLRTISNKFSSYS